MFALIDCNNFYASCERLFRPDLRNQPVVVLSNNDGCVIARSNEAKALKIAMGAPWFEIRALCRQHHVQVFSSNYALYGDMSQRVMSLIESSWPAVEIYSVDEAFLDLRSLPEQQHESFCVNLQKHILKSTGIPVSIGVGKTKTLAKLANHVCKKKLNIPVFNINHQTHWLKHIEVGDVWGVGRQWTRKLQAIGINTAADLAATSPQLLRSRFNIMLMRTAMELQGIACCLLEEASPNKSIVSSRSFGDMQTELTPLAQAVSSHVARACEKLREHHLLMRHLTVFIRTNPFRKDLPQHNISTQFRLVNATDDIRLITRIARHCLKQIYKPGFQYKKAGVYFEELSDRNQQQMDLFHQPDEAELDKRNRVMDVFDHINHRFGRHTIKLAAEGFGKGWAMKAELRSPRYTTQWSDLPVVVTGK